jgi:hypothetical protein
MSVFLLLCSHLMTKTYQSVAIRTLWVFNGSYYERRFTWIDYWPDSVATGLWSWTPNRDANTWTAFISTTGTINYPTTNGRASTSTSTNYGSSVAYIVHRTTNSGCFRGGSVRHSRCWYNVRPYWWQKTECCYVGTQPKAGGDGEFDEFAPKRTPNLDSSPPHPRCHFTGVTQWDMNTVYGIKNQGHTLFFYVGTNSKLTMIMAKPGNPNMTPQNWYFPYTMRRQN